MCVICLVNKHNRRKDIYCEYIFFVNWFANCPQGAERYEYEWGGKGRKGMNTL